MEQRLRYYEAALRQIRDVAGNLPDSELTSKTGANDAVARGLMVTRARTAATLALQATDEVVAEWAERQYPGLKEA